MHLCELPAEEAAARRFSEDLWLPFNRDLERTVDHFALIDADDADIVDEEVAFRLDRLAEDDYEVMVAVDAPEDADVDLADPDVDLADRDLDLAGFVSTSVDEAPDVFDRPDRLTVCDIYVKAPYRGDGLARRLMDHVGARADAKGCPEVRLDVDVGNERALAFYEKLGFEPYRHEMRLDADAL